MKTTSLVRLAGLCAGVFLLPLVGCNTTGTTTPRADWGPGAPITLDGDISEWPPESEAVADSRYVYFRFTVDQEQFTLQASPRSLVILIDADGNAVTGRNDPTPPMNVLGVDLEIEFSPRGPDGAGTGAAIFAIGSDGSRTRVESSEAELAFAPTYASTWYEVRVLRQLGLPNGPVGASGTLRGMAVLYDLAGQIEGYSDPFELIPPPAAESSAWTSPAMLPEKPVGAIRVMSYNVHKCAPVSKPDSFVRVIRATEPDVVLLQEWDQGDAVALEQWFRTLVPSDTNWYAAKGPAGVAIVARYPVTDAGISGDVKTPDGSRPIRFVTASVGTPSGPLCVTSAHLKCCGTMDSPEDQQRIDEARIINAAIGMSNPSGIRIIGGDFNLVGSRPPLDLLRAGLDSDGTDLTVVEPLLLGDRVMFTWRDGGTGFTPGRLDYVLYGDAAARVLNAFVLDTSRLSDATLTAAGLDRGDAAGSDHLPVVVDLDPS